VLNFIYLFLPGLIHPFIPVHSIRLFRLNGLILAFVLLEGEGNTAELVSEPVSYALPHALYSSPISHVRLWILKSSKYSAFTLA
jgi:hypothetical protein